MAQSKGKIFARNRSAYHDYKVLDKYEGGLVLSGSEVKSVRNGMVNLKDSFVSIEESEVWMWNCFISKWPYSNETGYDPLRKRKILLNRDEIATLAGKAKEKGLTIIPLELYGVRGRIKVLIGLCKGLKMYDKRLREKERDMKEDLRKQKLKYMVQ